MRLCQPGIRGFRGAPSSWVATGDSADGIRISHRVVACLMSVPDLAHVSIPRGIIPTGQVRSNASKNDYAYVVSQMVM